MNINWDAKGYTNNFSFVHQYGEGVLDLLDLPEGSSVLDLGCGNGALTQKMIDKGYDAFGLDNSPELLEIAKSNYPEITFVEGDARDFSLQKKVDGIFSNAVLHWIDEADQLNALQSVSNALKTDGLFVCEFGGYGCAATIHNALSKVFAKHGYSYSDPKYYPTIAQYSQKMEQVGLLPKIALLFDRWTPLNGNDGVYDWITMFVKIPFEQMSAEEAEIIKREAVELTRPKLYVEAEDTWYCDYVRIRIKAQKM